MIRKTKAELEKIISWNHSIRGKFTALYTNKMIKVEN